MAGASSVPSGIAAAHGRRVARLQEHMRARGMDAAILLKPRNMYYLSRFNAVMYSRPQFVVVPAEGAPSLVMPRLRERRAIGVTTIADIRSYHEADPDPARRHPETLLLGRLGEMLSGPAPLVGVEKEAMPLALHERLTRGLPAARFADIGHALAALRAVKDETELAEQAKAAAVAKAGMAEAQRILARGGTEIDINIGAEAAMAAAWRSGHAGDTIVGFGDDEDGVMSALWCWTRAGARAAITPPASTIEPIPQGEAVLVAIWTTINGYGVEYERTLFHGPPSPERAAAFATMMQVRTAIRTALRPGATPDAVAAAAGRIMAEAGLGGGLGLMGHGIGLGHHEHPHLRGGDTTVLEAGTVLTVEPAIVLPGCVLKHSDTLVVGEEGGRPITDWEFLSDGGGLPP